MEISSDAKMVAGIVLITVPTIEYGGAFLLGMLRHGDSAYMQNVLRQSLMRAGHAHAGVIVILALLCQLYADVAVLPGALTWLVRLGVPAAAILMSAGFFLSVLPPDTIRVGPAITLVYVGAVLLGIAVMDSELARSAQLWRYPHDQPDILFSAGVSAVQIRDVRALRIARMNHHAPSEPQRLRDRQRPMALVQGRIEGLLTERVQREQPVIPRMPVRRMPRVLRMIEN